MGNGRHASAGGLLTTPPRLAHLAPRWIALVPVRQKNPASFTAGGVLSLQAPQERFGERGDDRIAVTAQSSHSGGRPMSQRE